MEAETVVTILPAKDHQGSLENIRHYKGRGRTLLVDFRRSVGPCQHLDFGLVLGELILQSHETPHSEVLSHLASCDALLRQL